MWKKIQHERKYQITNKSNIKLKHVIPNHGENVPTSHLYNTQFLIFFFKLESKTNISCYFF